MAMKNAARTAVAAAIATALAMGSAGAAFAGTAVATDPSQIMDVTQVADAASQSDSLITEEEALQIALDATGLDRSEVSEYHIEVLTDSQFKPDAYHVSLYYNNGDDVVDCYINGFTGHVNMVNW